MKFKLVNVLIAIVVVGSSLGCQSEEFMTSEDGYQYKYIKKGDGKTPEEGEIVTYNMMYKNEKDSILFQSTSDQPALIQCNDVQWDNMGPLYKSFKMIKEGDSILIKIPTKTLFDESFRAAVPPSLDPEGFITFCIGAGKIRTEEEMQTEALAKRKEMEAEYLAANAEQINADAEVIDAYLAENNIEAESTESGLRYVIDVEGAGDYPKEGDNVVVHYTGTLLDGTKFDSSLDRGDPFKFQIGMRQVIIGWDEGIALLKPGGKGTLYVPSPLAYGDQARSEVIGPNSILKFDVELIGIE